MVLVSNGCTSKVPGLISRVLFTMLINVDDNLIKAIAGNERTMTRLELQARVKELLKEYYGLETKEEEDYSKIGTFHFHSSYVGEDETNNSKNTEGDI